MHTIEGWIALLLGVIFVILGIGGAVRLKLGRFAIRGALGAVLIILALLVL